MKNSVRFGLCWAALFFVWALFFSLIFKGINLVTENAYSTAKNEALMSAYADSKTNPISQEELLNNSEKVWEGKKLNNVSKAWQEDLLLKANSLLKNDNPVLYVLRYKHNQLFCWLALLVVMLSLVWRNRISVPANSEYLYTWRGKKLEPFKPGDTYVFPYFNFLRGEAKIPMNIQTLRIFSGVRKGESEAMLKSYIYGMDSNIEPETGDGIKAKYEVEIQCIDSMKLAYTLNDDPYKYIVKRVERLVGAYMKKPIKDASEGLSDHFLAKNWDVDILDDNSSSISLREEIKDFLGVNIIHFNPVDLILSEKSNAARLDIDLEVKRGELLKKRRENMEIEGDIAQKNNEIAAAKIVTIIEKAGVTGVEALNHITKEKTLETVAQASKTGNITYINGPGNDSFSNGAGFGWGLNASGVKPESKKETSDKPEEEKKEGDKQKKKDK